MYGWPSAVGFSFFTFSVKSFSRNISLYPKRVSFIKIAQKLSSIWATFERKLLVKQEVIQTVILPLWWVFSDFCHNWRLTHKFAWPGSATAYGRWRPVWPDKNRQMSIKVFFFTFFNLFHKIKQYSSSYILSTIIWV